MKMNIQIIAKRTGYTDENTEIVDIDICNGHWKYWDDHMDTDDKVSLTINTIGKAYYLNMPVKDTIDMHDLEHYKETGELKVTGTHVRVYDNLLHFLNCRIDNVKEDAKSGYWKICKINSAEFECTLFESAYSNYNDDLSADIVYAEDEEVVVKIAVIE